jgi:NAD(P)H-hydrate epimerase
VRADATVTFHGRKLGVVVAPGRFHAGRVHLADIGLEPTETRHALALPQLLRSVPRRSEHDTKYTSGHVVVVGGSPGMTGAPSLTAAAALRADAGYVTVAARESVLPVLEQRLVEAVKRPLPDALGDAAADAVVDLAARAGAVALGPGLGRDDGARRLVRRLLAELELPMVVDADALFELEPAAWPAPRVLTPHEGELGRLLGKDVAPHRLACVQEAAERFGCVVLLKGADTLVAAPGGGVLVAASGLPSLATAGTGDVLTGIVGAFLAKGLEPQRAAVAAALAQQRASVEAPQRAGLVAGDLLDALPRALA